MRIAFVYTKGRPKSFIGKTFGLQENGGSEGSAIRYALALASRGHSVSIHTSQAEMETFEGVTWYPEERKIYCLNQDVVVAVRFPEALAEVSAPVRALYCCDPEIPELPSFVESGDVNTVMVISKHQQVLFQLQHPIPDYFYFSTNAGIHWNDYDRHDISKVRGRCIYCSVQDRGLQDLVGIWPLIQKEIPWATLHITGSLALWGIDTKGKVDPVFYELASMPSVTYCGMLSREDLIQEQLQSVLMLLPGNPTSPEMCCMAAMECAAARNALLVVDLGALPERVIPSKTGSIIYRRGDWQRIFAETAVHMLRDTGLAITHIRAQMAEKDHDYEVLAQQWEKHFEELLDGGY